MKTITSGANGERQFKRIMEKSKVWRITTKDQVPADRKLLGTTWVFKVKKMEI